MKTLPGSREAVYEFNGLFRRFRQYEKPEDWIRLVMEAAGSYAGQAALLLVRGDALELRGQINLGVSDDLRIPLDKAAAFAAVVQSKETVSSLRTSREVGLALSAAGKVGLIFPIVNGPRVAAVLFAAGGEDAETEALELLCGIAGGALERHGNTSLFSQIAPVAPAPDAPAIRLAAWAGFPAEHRQSHFQARRFARVAAAEMQIRRPAACLSARAEGGLYMLLGKEIDKARETFHRQFMTIPTMVDYLHRELVAAILAGDALKLGPDYPGELGLA